jgi:hypothetical protein
MKTNNVVIESKQKGDGQKIIKYFKSLGVEGTDNMTGDDYSYNSRKSYYGVIDNVFGSWTESFLKSHLSVEIINLPEKINNVVIESVHSGDGPKIIKYFKSLGVDTRGASGNCYNDANGYHHNYYGVVNSNFGLYQEVDSNVKIITLPNETPKYPRIMLVSDINNKSLASRREVLGEAILFDGKKIYITLVDDCYVNWKYAEEIEVQPEPKTIEMTIEEIGKKLNIDPKILRIKE